ncbi:MAG: acyl-CoA dehydrogenase, partial [Acidimicrobiia bacterium]|nr:acyl-CoA dehydrogenase [Acidimicrobiia bacterium]
MSSTNRPARPNPKDFLDFDRLLDPEERLLRDTVRRWVGDRVLPSIGDWYHEGI